MKKLVTLGEIMMRLTTTENKRFTQTESYDIVFGGSEANVAVSVCNYGMKAAFVTKLPKHDIGQAALNSLRRFGVETESIVRGGDRLGIYYVEKGNAQRMQGIVYDRKDSAMATSKREEFNWQQIFDGADWFHFSGITPALSEECAEICLSACKAAKNMGITVSCDLNYRDKLWSREKAEAVMSKLCKYVDVCIAYEDEPGDVFGIKPVENAGKPEYYMEIAISLYEKFNFRKIAITKSHSYSAMEIDWSAMLFDGDGYYFSKQYQIKACDRIGGGDAFCGGFIYAALNGYEKQELIEFATAAGCLKYTVEGDYNMVTAEEVSALANK